MFLLRHFGYAVYRRHDSRAGGVLAYAISYVVHRSGRLCAYLEGSTTSGSAAPTYWYTAGMILAVAYHAREYKIPTAATFLWQTHIISRDVAVLAASLHITHLTAVTTKQQHQQQ